MSNVRVAVAGDRSRVLESLSAAFVADPVLRYLFPSDADYASGAPLFFGALFDKRLAAGTVWVADDGSAAALWDAPDATGSSDMSALAPDVLARIDAYDAAVHDALPTEPHWYLGVLGAHPDAAGRGLGRALIDVGLARATDQGVPAVLETSNPSNVGFYERGGWEVVGEIAAPVPTWILRHP